MYMRTMHSSKMLELVHTIFYYISVKLQLISVKQHNCVQDNASHVLQGLYYFAKCYPCFVNEEVKAQKVEVTLLCIFTIKIVFKFLHFYFKE